MSWTASRMAPPVLTALLLTPTRRWWLILLAVTPVHGAVQWMDGAPPLGILSQLAGNFSQALLAASATTNETAFATYKVVRSAGMLVFDNQARV